MKVSKLTEMRRLASLRDQPEEESGRCFQEPKKIIISFYFINLKIYKIYKCLPVKKETRN